MNQNKCNAISFEDFENVIRFKGKISTWKDISGYRKQHFHISFNDVSCTVGTFFDYCVCVCPSGKKQESE